MATVQYGRKGPSRKSSNDADAYEPTLESRQMMPSGRKTKVINPREYDRIKASLNAHETAEIARHQKEQEKERLRALSRKQVNSWNNTLSGQRKAKLEAKTVREEMEEQCRQEEDIQEAIYKAAERKKSIQHAKTLTFAQTDRVKGFHGALILTEVLKEREAQLDLKKERLEAQAEREKRLHLKELEALQVADGDEQKAAEKRMVRTKEVQKYQLAQIKRKRDLAAEIQKEQSRDCEENLLVRAEQANNEMLKQQLIEEQNNYMRECFFAHLASKESLMEQAKRKEAEEERERMIFNDHKRRRGIIQQQKQKEKQEAQARIQGNLNVKLGNQLKEQEKATEELCRRAVIEADKKIEAAHKAKQIKAQKGIDEMKQRLRQQREEAERQRQEQLDAEYIEKRGEMRADEEHRQRELDRAKERKDIAITFRDHHLKQVNATIARQRKEHELDLACDETINKLNRLEEKEFLTYARDVIDETVKKGRNPYPMVKAARAGAGGGRGPRFSGVGGLKPSYMTCDETGVQMPNYSQRKSTLELKKKFNLQGNKAKKRLGLIWQL